MTLALTLALGLSGVASTGAPAAALPVVRADAPTAVVNVDHRRHWGGGWGYRYDRDNRTRDILGAGVIGLGVGALLGSALSQPRVVYDPPVDYYDPPPVYDRPAPRLYYRSAPRAYYGGPIVYRRVPPPIYAPPVRSASGYPMWSAGWYSYCEARYRSFDPRSGTFLGYDGRRRYCR